MGENDLKDIRSWNGSQATALEGSAVNLRIWKKTNTQKVHNLSE